MSITAPFHTFHLITQLAPVAVKAEVDNSLSHLPINQAKLKTFTSEPTCDFSSMQFSIE